MSNEVIIWRMNHILNHYGVKSIKELAELLDQQDNNGAKYRIQCDLKKLKVLNDLNNYESS